MNKTVSKLTKQKALIAGILCCIALFLLIIRVFYIQVFMSDFLQDKAYEQQTRDRLIKAVRGDIVDRNFEVLASTETVVSISVINAQIKDMDLVVKTLSDKLALDYDYVLKKSEKKVALERIATKVSKEIGDEIRQLKISGIVIDEDVKRVYPYNNLASQVIGFVGKDNQGIIGLEAKYDEYLRGEQGKILTETDGKGMKMPGGGEYRVEPQNGYNLVTSIDYTLQEYTEQTLENALLQTQAKRGAIILMDPNNGEILAMANKPDFDLNDPFTINDENLASIWDSLSSEEQNNNLNKMWRNFSINDTYEPGSTFKIFTSAAGFEENKLSFESRFNCTGSVNVAGVNIRCWRSPRSHGSENFLEGIQNSCNPVFIKIAEDIGVDAFYKNILNFGFNQKTGIDLSGEASGILHKIDNVGPVELATMSFGQSFQVTPLQMLKGAAILVNGGYNITPHFGTKIIDDDFNIIYEYDTKNNERIISEETSNKIKEALELVVYSGTGNKTYIPGLRVGGKTATSEKLPRGNGKYIASFLAFAPADDPKVVALVLIDEPVGAYYGGQVAGPIMKEVLENALPYLKIEPIYRDEELKLEEVMNVVVPDLKGKTLLEAKKISEELGFIIETESQKDIENKMIIIEQFPAPEEIINRGEEIILYFD